MLNIGNKTAELRQMTVGELRRTYSEVFGEATRSFHKEFLVRRIAWRLQAHAEGGLPERARRRALELAHDADLRSRPIGATRPGDPIPEPAATASTTVRQIDVSLDARLPMPGALLTREYRGRTIRVRVLPKGFDYDGTVYRSLSAVAKAVTGSHWNGYLFFGIQPPKRTESR